MARVTIQLQAKHDQELRDDARQSQISKNSLITSILRKKVKEKLKPTRSKS